MTFGEKIKNLRKDNKMSQEAFAQIIGVSRRTVIDWEKDKYSPQSENIKSICNCFNINSEYFLSDNFNNTVEAKEEPKPEVVEEASTESFKEADDTSLNNNESKVDIENNIVLNNIAYKRYLSKFLKENKLIRWHYIVLSLILIIDIILFIFDAMSYSYVWLITIPVTIFSFFIYRKVKNVFYNKLIFKMNDYYFNKGDGLLITPIFPLYYKKSNDRILFYLEDKMEMSLALANISYTYISINGYTVQGLIPRQFINFADTIVITFYLKNGNQSNINIIFNFNKSYNNILCFIRALTIMNINKVLQMIK